MAAAPVKSRATFLLAEKRSRYSFEGGVTPPEKQKE